ncbi:MAG: double-strand break repair helicase AddA [Alphaproteobacteria bacterium]|nr:double-strand break repair helicase AddA [Alphaproteobacteria bacterium]
MRQPSRSERQREAADPQLNVWVSASAGSGKTSVLVDRLLRLLLSGIAPERLLCLTFTKAAAAEMSDRLFRELSRWTILDETALRASLQGLTGAPAGADACQAARRLFARSLDAAGGLRIQTIHGFCETVLARFPLEADRAPNFAVLDERTALEVLMDARDRTLSAAGHDPALGQALSVFAGRVAEERFTQLMAALVSERSRVLRALRRGSVRATRLINRYLGVAVGTTAADVIAAACRPGSFDELGLRWAAQALRQSGKTDRDQAAILEEWLANPGRRPALFDKYLGVYFTQQGKPRATLAHQGAIRHLPDAETILGRERDRLAAVQEQRRAADVAESSAALLRIGEALLRHYDAEKRRRNQVDYDDLILEVRALLDQPGVAPWVLYKLDGGIDHILVDEAQDTSPEQWDVIVRLAEEFFAGEGIPGRQRTLFVVGDEKQSIFSFQGADPAAFARLRRFFHERVTHAQQEWRDVPLRLSFRAVPALLELVDRVFERHSGVREGVTVDGGWQPHEAHRLGHAGLVELWPPTVQETAELETWGLPVQQDLLATPESRLARRIAGTIRDWIDRAEIIASLGRPVAPGDVLILVRRRNLFFEEMVLALKQCGVPVAGADRMVLVEQLAVEDLLAAARFVLLPEDDLTLATLLKSPFVGLSEQQLFDLAASRGETGLWVVLRRRREEDAAFAQAHAFCSSLLARADFAPPFEFFAGLLSGGGRERLLARLGPEINDPVDELLARALSYQREHVPSLQGFIHWIERDRGEVKRDLEQARNQVRVMTVHGAKGLEAPIVFLPDLCTLPPNDRLFFWAADDKGRDVLLWPLSTDLDDVQSSLARQLARRENDREYRRLLYVALTRAADRLYLCGYENRQGRRPECWYELLRPVMEQMAERVTVALPGGGSETVWRYVRPQEVATGRLPLGGEKMRPLPPLPAWARQAPAPDPLPPRPLAPSRPGVEQWVRSPFADEAGRFRRGQAVHRLLQSLPNVPHARRAELAALFLARPGLGFSPDEQRAIAAETLAVLADVTFARVFDPTALAEVPLTGVLGSTVLSGQIDRLLIAADEVLIVDFKTNRDPPADAAGVSPAYRRQMAAYWSALRSIYPDRPVRCALVWTVGPRLIELPPDFLAAAAP